MVSRDGVLVTNAHVVSDCIRVAIKLDGENLPVKVVAQDEKLDLALLRVGRVFQSALPLRAASISLGEDATVFGFPFSGLLSPSLSLTKGVVSSLGGLVGESIQFQITAQVQPGNSGGPIVDSAGHVIGVVVATLDAIKVARATGSIPQNINFGIRSEVLRLFLDSNSVRYTSLAAAAGKTGAEIARQVAPAVFLVECF